MNLQRLNLSRQPTRTHRAPVPTCPICGSVMLVYCTVGQTQYRKCVNAHCGGGNPQTRKTIRQ